MINFGFLSFRVKLYKEPQLLYYVIVSCPLFLGALVEVAQLSGSLGLAFAGGAACYRPAGTLSWDTVPPVFGTLRLAKLYWTSGLWGQEPGRPGPVGFLKGGQEDTLQPDTFYAASFEDSVFVMVKDITQLLASDPSGPVACRKLGSEPGFAWALVLIYEDPSLPMAHVSVLEGALALKGESWASEVSLGAVSDEPWGYILLFSVGGEEAWAGDWGRFGSLTLANSRNPADNIGNETLYDPRTGRFKALAYPDGPADLDLFDISGALSPGEVLDTLSLGSSADWLYYGLAVIYNAYQRGSGVAESPARAPEPRSWYDLSGRRRARGVRVRDGKLVIP